jgi:SH3-like domain-containing protein
MKRARQTAAFLIAAMLCASPARAATEAAPHADRPHPDQTHPDKTHPDKTHADKPHADKAHADKPHPDHAHAADQAHPDRRRREAGHKPAHPAAPHPAPPAAPPPVAVVPPPAEPAEPSKGSASGLPLPRYAALKSDEVNMRAGPGTRYPIEWVYKRHDLPVEIEREFEVWRLVRDPDGTKGWVHQATLSGRRAFMVIGADRTMRRSADDTAAAVAVLKPGVIGRLRSCDAASDWCEVQVGEYRGFLHREEFWGTYPSEAVGG